MPTQLELFRTQADSAQTHAEYGTFKDSLKAPIHRWFQYPAGYSYKLVEAKIREYHLSERSWILDPFVGCGTTAVVAKLLGMNSRGVEAHPFVYEIAQVKTFWEYDRSKLSYAIDHVCQLATTSIQNGGLKKADLKSLPELVHKCYSPTNLARLVVIRDTIKRVKDPRMKGFLNLALTATLRNAAKVATGWPYIAPTKLHERAAEKNGLEAFCLQVRRMFEDVVYAENNRVNEKAICQIIQGDARDFASAVPENSIDLAVTSPPYLNNYDYADRTRLETYFFGLMSSWGEITEKIRTRLITSATTQINRTAYDEEALITQEVRDASPKVYRQLVDSVAKLQVLRTQKGGKKSYDILVAGYFNDMVQVLKQVYRALKAKADFIVVLGDSAPYGVHVPTELYLGELGKGIGFSSCRIEPLRTRGGKWAKNPQRHNVPLRESILTLSK